jgi:hypothetical protein
MDTKQSAALEASLNEHGAAAFLGIKPATLRVWRSTRRYDLPYIKVGRSVRYRPADLTAFVERQRVTAAEAA